MSSQQFSPGAVVSRIWEIYRANAAVLIGTALLLFALQFVLILLVPGASVAAAILFWAVSVLYQGMVVELVQDVQDGRRDHSVGAMLRSVEPVLLQLMAVSVIFAVGVAIGFVLIIIPGLYLLVVWSVVAPVTVLERPGIFSAFGRSMELVRGHRWAVFGVIIVVSLAVLIVSLAVGLATASLGSVGRALVQWAVNAAVAPVSALSASVIYFRLRSSGALAGAALAGAAGCRLPRRVAGRACGGCPCEKRRATKGRHCGAGATCTLDRDDGPRGPAAVCKRPKRTCFCKNYARDECCSRHGRKRPTASRRSPRGTFADAQGPQGTV